MKKNLLIVFVFFCLCLIAVFSRPIEKPERNGFDNISNCLTNQITEVIRSSGGTLYHLAKNDFLNIFSTSVGVQAGLIYDFKACLFLKKITVSSTYEAFELHRKIYGNLLPKLNALRSLRPYLAEFPITPNSFSLNIYFVEELSQHPPKPYFEGLIKLHLPRDLTTYFGLIQYNKRKEETQDLYQDVYRIPYNKIPGLAPLFASKAQRGPCKEPSWMFVDPLPANAPIFKKAVYDFIPKFGKPNNLRLIVCGIVENRRLPVIAFGFALAGTHKLLLEGARKLAAECASQFLYHIQNDEEARNYVIKWNEELRDSDHHQVPNSQDFSFRLSFWDEGVDRRENPYIAEIRMLNSKFQYFTSDEGQRLVLVHEETFDEAMKFLEREGKAQAG